jgi:hypothetical protein
VRLGRPAASRSDRLDPAQRPTRPPWARHARRPRIRERGAHRPDAPAARRAPDPGGAWRHVPADAIRRRGVLARGGEHRPIREPDDLRRWDRLAERDTVIRSIRRRRHGHAGADPRAGCHRHPEADADPEADPAAHGTPDAHPDRDRYLDAERDPQREPVGEPQLVAVTRAVAVSVPVARALSDPRSIPLAATIPVPLLTGEALAVRVPRAPDPPRQGRLWKARAAVARRKYPLLYSPGVRSGDP